MPLPSLPLPPSPPPPPRRARDRGRCILRGEKRTASFRRALLVSSDGATNWNGAATERFPISATRDSFRRREFVVIFDRLTIRNDRLFVFNLAWCNYLGEVTSSSSLPVLLAATNLPKLNDALPPGSIRRSRPSANMKIMINTSSSIRMLQLKYKFREFKLCVGIYRTCSVRRKMFSHVGYV